MKQKPVANTVHNSLLVDFPSENPRALPMLVSFYYFRAVMPQRNHAQTRWQQAQKKT